MRNVIKTKTLNFKQFEIKREKHLSRLADKLHATREKETALQRRIGNLYARRGCTTEEQTEKCIEIEEVS
jgi:hypothetical protein